MAYRGKAPPGAVIANTALSGKFSQIFPNFFFQPPKFLRAFFLVIYHIFQFYCFLWNLPSPIWKCRPPPNFCRKRQFLPFYLLLLVYAYILPFSRPLTVPLWATRPLCPRRYATERKHGITYLNIQRGNFLTNNDSEIADRCREDNTRELNW